MTSRAGLSKGRWPGRLSHRRHRSLRGGTPPRSHRIAAADQRGRAMNAVLHSIAPASADIGLLAWLNQAEPGDALEYHRGFLALDRSGQSPALSDDDRIALGQLASLAMRLANRGLVDLVQRRIARDCFSYLAIARSRNCDSHNSWTRSDRHEQRILNTASSISPPRRSTSGPRSRRLGHGAAARPSQPPGIMARGKAVEHGVHAGLSNPRRSIEECIEGAEREFDREMALSADARREDERKKLAGWVGRRSGRASAIRHAGRLPGEDRDQAR